MVGLTDLRAESGHRAVAGELEDVRGGTHEGDAGRGTGLGELGVLGQEAVAGVDGVGAGPLGGADDLGHVQVGAHRVVGSPIS